MYLHSVPQGVPGHSLEEEWAIATKVPQGKAAVVSMPGREHAAGHL